MLKRVQYTSTVSTNSSYVQGLACTLSQQITHVSHSSTPTLSMHCENFSLAVKRSCFIIVVTNV